MEPRKTLAGAGALVLALGLVGSSCWYAWRRKNIPRVYVQLETGGPGALDIGYVDRAWAKPKPLCPTDARRLSPAISPGGKHVAWIEHGPAETRLHVMTGECEGDRVVATLTQGQTFTDVSWSPDGSALVYTAFLQRPATGLRSRWARVGAGDFEVFVVRREGGAPPVDVSNDLADDKLPAWSRDGSTIAFVSTREGEGDVYAVSPEGGPASPVTHGERVGGPVAWSRDGRILFGRRAPGGQTSIVAARPGDADVQTIVEGTHRAITAETESLELTHPVVSPDGDRVAFHGVRTGSNVNTSFLWSRIFVARIDGSDLHAVVHGQASCPVFSPDSKRIAALVTRSGPAPDAALVFPVEGGEDDVLVTTRSCFQWPAAAP